MGFLEDNGIKAVCFDIDGTLYPKYQTNLYLLKAAVAHPVFSYRYNKMRGEIRRVDGLEGVKRTSLSSFPCRDMMKSIKSTCMSPGAATTGA